MELVPHLKKENVGPNTPKSTIYMKVMREFDPESYQKHLETQRQLSRRVATNSRKILKKEPSAEKKRQLIREGKWKLLVPFLGEKPSADMTSKALRRRVMKEFDAESYKELLAQERHYAKKYKALESKNNGKSPDLEKDNLLAMEPKGPQPTPDKMRDMFRQGLYKELAPYFKDQLQDKPNLVTIKNKIMQLVDPEGWQDYLVKIRRSSTVSANGKDPRFYPVGKQSEVVQALLAIEPNGPPPSMEEQLQMFRDGRYRELIPFYRDQLTGKRKTLTGVRNRIMELVDPEAWALYLAKQKMSLSKKMN
jgi:hypothetical protein